MRFYAIIFIALLFVYSCNVDTRDQFYNKDGLLVKRTFYPNNIVKAERTFKNDTIGHGYGKLYYPNGNLKIEINYKDGEKYGVEKEFYENGLLKHVGKNVNNYPDSVIFKNYKDTVIVNIIVK